jgi:uncharacterized protein YkwD
MVLSATYHPSPITSFPKLFTTQTSKSSYTRPMKFLLFVLLTLGSLVSGQVLQASYEPLAGNPVLELDLLTKTNAARAANGLPALQLAETLSLAARHHALEMATLNYFSHQSPTPGNTTPPSGLPRLARPISLSVKTSPSCHPCSL